MEAVLTSVMTQELVESAAVTMDTASGLIRELARVSSDQKYTLAIVATTFLLKFGMKIVVLRELCRTFHPHAHSIPIYSIYT